MWRLDLTKGLQELSKYENVLLGHYAHRLIYRQISNISRAKSQNLNVSRLVLQLSVVESIEARCQVANEDAVGAAPAGDALTKSEWSKILMPTKVRLILEVSDRYVWIYIYIYIYIYI